MANPSHDALAGFVAPINVLRSAGGTVVSGRWTPGAPVTLNIIASIQPASGDDIRILPEGTRSRDAIKIYTQTELFTVDESEEQDADIIQYNGRDYQVQTALTYRMGGMEHTKALAVRKDVE